MITNYFNILYSTSDFIYMHKRVLHNWYSIVLLHCDAAFEKNLTYYKHITLIYNNYLKWL